MRLGKTICDSSSLLCITVICNSHFLGQKPFMCQNCYRSYTRLGGLRQHLRYECGKEPQFICKEEGCTYRCKRKENFKQHMYRHGKVLDKNI